jgi:hypothetical protein
MSDTMTTPLVAAIKAWALDNYEKSYGASCIIECYSDSEIAQQFKSLKDAQRFAELMTDRFMDAEGHMHGDD